jgi:hypothetical protein
MIIRFHVAVLAGLCLTGCFPYHYTDRPGVSGSVVDEIGSAPISNATVLIRTHDLKHRTGEIQATCNAEGMFYLAPVRSWGIYIIPMDVFGPFSEVTIDAPGYESKTVKLPASAMGPAKVVLGEVKLKRLQ